MGLVTGVTKLGGAARWTGWAIAAAMAAGAGAQTAQTAPAGDQAQAEDTQVPDTGLNIPANLQIFGKLDPNVRKPTAVVNDVVITGTDVDQRVALILIANQLQLTAHDMERLKLQVLRQLIDETLQIQEAKAHDVEVSKAEIDESYARIARNFKKTPAELGRMLRQDGSSDASLRRQIEGEIAWSRYLRRRVEPQINVGDEEVNAILDRLKADKGTPEYHLKEIYLNGPNAAASAQQLMEQIKSGKAPFEYYARNFSDSPTKAVGGDLDYVRASQLPDQLAAATQQMQPGQVAGPIEAPGGYSILYLVDKRQVLMSDPRDARLTLKQLTVKFPQGVTQAEATKRASAFASTLKDIHGCGGVNKAAATIGAEVVDSDSLTIRQLPPQLQDILLKMQVGEASPPFGSPQDGVRSIVLCGRDDPPAGALPNATALQDQMVQQRVNLRAQQLLRDLRRDAIIEYR